MGRGSPFLAGSLLATALLVGLFACRSGEEAVSGESIRIDPARCRLEVERIYADGAFVTVVSFRVGEDHAPEQITILSNPARIAESEYRSCLSTWRIGTLPVGTEVFAAFRREGAAGWRHLRLSARAVGFSEEISLEQATARESSIE